MGFLGIFERKIEYEVVTAKIKNRTFRLQVADTFRKLAVGLMRHEGLARNGGMLFIFSHDGRHGIWMLHMKFPIDIIWLDGRKRIVHIASDAKPCRSIFGCRTERPQEDARYVVELGSGTANELKLKRGDRFIFMQQRGA
jgi:uncharacterized protein